MQYSSLANPSGPLLLILHFLVANPCKLMTSYIGLGLHYVTANINVSDLLVLRHDPVKLSLNLNCNPRSVMAYHSLITLTFCTLKFLDDFHSEYHGPLTSLNILRMN